MDWGRTKLAENLHAFHFTLMNDFQLITLLARVFLKWTVPLKVPNCEIFDRSDFSDFYTIKSLRVGDFGVKKKKLKIFRGSFRGAKFLTRMLSLFLRRFFFLSWGQKIFILRSY